MANFYRVTWSGNIGGAEVFSHGLSYRKEVDTPPSGLLAGMAAVVATIWGAGATILLPALVDYERVRIERFDFTSGDVVDSAEQTITTSGTAGSIVPLQVALCVSLRTALAGRRFRGRMFLPPMSVGTIDGTGRYAASNLTTLADQIKLALDPLHDVAAGDGWVVYSRGNGTTDVPASTFVTSFDLGNVPDTMRTRRNRLVESRTVRALA